MTRRSLLIRFFLVALPLLVALGILHVLDRQTERARWAGHMERAVRQAANGLGGGFHEAATDALALAGDREFRDGLLIDDCTRPASRFEALARFKPHYRQIRYIDETGMERLRVDATPRGVVRVPQDALQDKANRDYFRDAAGLSDGAVRLSRLDLNIEHGRIEEPHNPMLRFSTPVFDLHGTRRGVIVINLGVAPLLARLEESDAPTAGRHMLINAKGSWLAGGEPALRWGDMLGNGNGFARSRPEAWRYLTGATEGKTSRWEAAGRLYAMQVIHPVDVVRAGLTRADIEVSGADPWWAVVSEADLANVDAAPLGRLNTGLTFAGVALGIWLFVLFGWQRLKRAAHVANLRIRQLAQVVEQTSDLVFITDPEGRIEYVNPAFSHSTGYAREEAEGRLPSILKSGQHSASFFQALWNEIKQGRQFRDLFINRRRDGELFYEEKTVSPLKDDAGRITGFVSTGKDITHSKVTRLAFHDQLTGLVNRVLFMDRLQHEMIHAQRAEQRLAVLYMDLDGFKAINDSAGHQTGDEILREFARRVGALMRKSDTFARLGGDEFACLLRDIGDVAAAERVATKIVEVVRDAWHVGDGVFSLGVSIGIALYPADIADSDELLARADAAMYDAKRNGRNRHVVHDPDATLATQ
ncbi:MAG: diguanylate cyclase [Pseudomonadota bacterium]